MKTATGRKATRKTSKTTAPARDAIAEAYDALDNHERHELLSQLGTSVVDQPREAAKLAFRDLPASVQAAVRASQD